jgi:guanine nucleotide-binding protein G(o) subunit alpha
LLKILFRFKKCSLKVCFPEYDGEDGDYDHGVTFLQDEFENKNRNPDKQIYLHVTCATDTNNISAVFNAVKDIVIRKSLNEAGLV